MNDAEALETTLRRALDALSGLGLQFHCTGGLVASLYGEPRFTQDIDIVINVADREECVTLLIGALASKFLIDPDATRRAIARDDMFQALDLDTYIKIDFHVGEAIPGELQRSIPREIFPGLTTNVVAVEDSILSKLLWIQKGSEKSRRDVVMILRGPEAIDWPALTERAKELKIDNLLEALRQESKIG